MGAIARTIIEEVSSWPGVESHPHRFGGVEFTIDHREIGHLHGDRLADLPFPTRIRDELIASGRARPHHVLPESGWVSRWIRHRTSTACTVDDGMPRRSPISMGPSRCFQRRCTILRTTGVGVRFG